MGKLRLRFAIKFLFIKGLRSKAIHTELGTTSGAMVYSLAQVKWWVGPFQTGDFSCQDHYRTESRPSGASPQSPKSFRLHTGSFWQAGP
jgi:hypothetical protein